MQSIHPFHFSDLSGLLSDKLSKSGLSEVFFKHTCLTGSNSIFIWKSEYPWFEPKIRYIVYNVNSIIFIPTILDHTFYIHDPVSAVQPI